MRTRRAFSLIEVVMVMAIMAVMAAIAAPRYANSLARYRVDLAARRIVADLALAQNRARITSSSRTATFNSGKSLYQLTGIADFKTVATDYTVVVSNAPYQCVFGKIDLGGDESITFNGFGLPDSGGAIVITSGSAQKTITIDVVTGRGSIQ